MSDDVIDIQPSQPDDTLKTWGWVSYILHLIVAVAAVVPSAQPSIAVLIIALIIDLVKKGDAAGTWQASHFRWRIRTVLWAGALYLITAVLWFPFIAPGWIAWMVISIWFLYRIVKGMERMNAGQPVGAPS